MRLPVPLLLALALSAAACARPPMYGTKPKPPSAHVDSVTLGSDTTTHRPEW